ncbi:MAG TPA: HEPN domain-containing protein [Phycisphaerae bacterium]|nr:HEPN domain-containing protein [Phycisphaerae bacterium]
MSGSAVAWMHDARENVQMAELALQANLFNPCLHNCQQAVEKALKAARVHCGLTMKRVHGIRKLNRDLLTRGVNLHLTDEECGMLDSIYVASKYPADSVLPDSPPDAAIAGKCLELARRTVRAAAAVIGELDS